MEDIWPTEIRLKKDRRGLVVAFDTGETFDLSSEYLRVMSPSAEVQGHSPDERKTVPGKINVEIMKLEPVGNYAIKIDFDDMHDTGIYSWQTLAELGRQHDALWARYLSELQQQGMSREPAPVPGA
ncbi:MAG: hypothetical protein C0606_01100 [Hyphomicrobiales bacterium]|nr:MAG: hypothetical protein C0606_01100 [Hyphomicrobiales bacterium]